MNGAHVPDSAIAVDGVAQPFGRHVLRVQGFRCSKVQGGIILSMAKKASAGLLLFRRRGDLEVFLVHPGGPFWA
jgi:hypothetical protein